MNNELKGSRLIHLYGHDLELAKEKNRVKGPVNRIREKEISSFCGECDQLKPDNTCTFVDVYEQATRVAIAHCNIALVDGKEGRMTEKGFTLFERKSIREAVLKRFRR